MAWIEREQLAKAKSIDLYSYLTAAEPDNIKRCGQDEYCLKDHDSLKVSVSNGKWHWHSQGEGGTTAVQYLIRVRGYSLPIAAKMVLDSKAASCSPFVQRPPTRPLVLPERHSDNNRVISYLCGKRGLCREVVEYCISNGSLYESVQYHSCVFVGRDSNGKPRHAAIRATKGDFKQDIEGSDKRYSFALHAQKKDSTVLCVYEGAIDALSGASLQLMVGRPWKDRHYLSLAGVSSLPIIQYLNVYPAVTTVRLCMDNDQPGRFAAEQIAELLILSRPTMEIEYGRPKTGKDYNEHLRRYIAKNKIVKKKMSKATMVYGEFL